MLQLRRSGRGTLRFGLALLRAAVVGPLTLAAWLALRTKDDNLLLAGGTAHADKAKAHASTGTKNCNSGTD